MANVPPSIVLPSAAPTSDPALAGYFAQLGISLNQWIGQVAAVLNGGDLSSNTVAVGDWTIAEQANGSLVLTYAPEGGSGGTVTIAAPAGTNILLSGVPE